MHLLPNFRKQKVTLPEIEIEEQGDHSTPLPKHIDAPIRLLLNNCGFTEGKWILKVHRAKIYGTAANQGRVRIYGLILNRVIDMIIQPGLVGTRRRVNLIVPPEYSAKEVYDKLSPKDDSYVLISTPGGTLIDTSGNIVPDQVVYNARPTKKEKTDIRLAKIALRFWDNPANLDTLGQMLEPKVTGLGSLQGIYAQELKEAIEKIWASPSNFAVAYPLLSGTLCDPKRHGILCPIDDPKQLACKLTEHGWVWIESVREKERLRQESYRQSRLLELQKELKGLQTKRKTIERRYNSILNNLDEQIASAVEALSVLES